MEALYHQSLAAAPGKLESPEWLVQAGRRSVAAESKTEALRPNFAVRCAFYLSIAAMPFLQLYIPGTGERLGIKRIVQGLLLLAMFTRPKVSVRLVPVCLLWMLAYCAIRIIWGLWLA